jgi:hypothetical protein
MWGLFWVLMRASFHGGRGWFMFSRRKRKWNEREMKREDTITIQPLKGTKRKQIKMQGPNLITVEDLKSTWGDPGYHPHSF